VSQPRKRIKGKFFPVPDELMKSKLAEYIEITGIIAYELIGLKQNGDREHDDNLNLTYKEAGRFMSSHTFAKAIFRLWAYRMIRVVNWGRRGREPSRYALYNKWRTLIRMPEKLNTLHDLVNEYEEIHKKHYIPGSGNPGTKKSFYAQKRNQLIAIKKRIIHVPL